ncbi:ABC transporter permease [Paenibacillus harenae]|uniref:Simple sugar transport system permease protein n=1 Tax=Paenibacillus harenae TaxID=306543 RepID=A0ABT9TTU2_PAEHA|nr:ABC transporter permease [Paenibacillus harenae]MDQ0061364.1 simple sugar transport system permease protein [Paenibacillus harenae]MDQ0110765.1 simple sugar transport system permease protein [Paenibacillus harenae]
MELFDVSLFASMLRLVTPILLAALGGAICARVGLFNVGLEGLMLTGAFSAIVGNYYTGNVWLAVIFAVLCTVIFSMLFAYMSIHLKANVIVVGISLNFLAAGLTTFMLRVIFDVKGAYYNKDMVGLPKWDIPLLRDIPWLGDVLSGHTPLVYLAIVLAIGLQLFFFKTVTGFRLLASGENPTAARSLGIKVTRIQYGAVLLCGVLCGLAGAQLSLGNVTMFTEGMTAGRGFIALVATMLGQSNPLGVAASSLLFGLMDALSLRLQGFSLPTHFTMMLPYVVTIVAMLIFKNKSYMQEARKANESSR